MEHEDLTVVGRETGLSKQDLVAVVKNGIVQATGVLPPEELINDIVDAVAMYVSARMRHSGQTDAKFLQVQLQEKLKPHIGKLIEFAAATATQYATDFGGQYYMGWISGKVSGPIASSLASALITSGVNSAIEMIASTIISGSEPSAKETLTITELDPNAEEEPSTEEEPFVPTFVPLTEDELSDWVFTAGEQFGQEWALIGRTFDGEKWVELFELSDYALQDPSVAGNLVEQKFQEYQVTKYAEGPLTNYVIDDYAPNPEPNKNLAKTDYYSLESSGEEEDSFKSFEFSESDNEEDTVEMKKLTGEKKRAWGSWRDPESDPEKDI